MTKSAVKKGDEKEEEKPELRSKYAMIDLIKNKLRAAGQRDPMVMAVDACENNNLDEEGYDMVRDQGKVKTSKDKKDATTMPVSDEVKKTKKVNKGSTPLDFVKKKYGKAVMNVDKKKKDEKEEK